MPKIRKLLVAVIGLLAIVGRDWVGLELDDSTMNKLVDVIMAAITAWGLYAVPND